MFDLHLSPIKINLSYNGHEKTVEGDMLIGAEDQTVEIEVSYGTARATVFDQQGKIVRMLDKDIPEGMNLAQTLAVLTGLAREAALPL